MQGLDTLIHEKFKCQNKQGISLISELNNITIQQLKDSVTNDPSNSDIASIIKPDFMSYSPFEINIVNDFKEIEVLYDERLGTAKLTLVEHVQTGKVSFSFNPFVIIISNFKTHFIFL